VPPIRPPLLPALALATLLSTVLAACGGGSDNSGPPPATVQLNGKITYDFVPAVTIQNPQGGSKDGLDYDSTEARPARGVQIEAVGDGDKVLASATAGADGSYALMVPPNTSVRLRAKARLLQAPGSGPSWDFSIRDNTSPGYASDNAALYAVQGDAFNSGSGNQTRNLHAASGWTGNGYGNARSAAPFAILDQFYSAMQKVLAADPQAVFAPMNAYWSINNRAASGDKGQGYIGTSHWSAGGDQPGLYILGNENSDTDEYDTGVVVHEWGHYFESRFSRADSIGGPHGAGDALDMRLAFGEGWGNALAGMVRDDPIYVDTMGPQQAQVGVVLDLNSIPDYEPLGWFNESSVQYVLYQMYKTPSLGFPAIYKVMVGPQKNTEALTSLFSFSTYLRDQADPAGKAAIDQLLAGVNTVNGDALDIWGTGQTYPALSSVLPIYTGLELDQPETVCATDDLGDDGNKLGNFRYLRLPVAQAGTYKLRVIDNDATGLGLQLVLRGQDVPYQSLSNDTVQANLDAGVYVAAIWSKPLSTCFTVTLSKQ